MARPTKTKIDYFPIDCTEDSRMKLIELKHGLVAYAIYIKLLQKIYGNKGYYIEWNEDSILLFAGEYGLDIDLLCEITDEMLKRGIFNKEIYDNHSVLTSKEIQEQYFFVISKRKIKELNESYCLINSEKTGVSDEKTIVSDNNNTHSIGEDSIGEDSIVKDSIVKDSIAEDRRVEEITEALSPTHEKARGEFNNVILTEAEYDMLLSKYANIDHTINRLSQYMAASGKSYASHYAVLSKWAQEDNISPTSSPPAQNTDNTSYEIDDFFKTALRRSYSDDIVEYLTN